MLSSSGRWFYWSQSDAAKKSIKRVLGAQSKAKAVCFVFLGGYVLQALGVGKMVYTIVNAGGGRRNWFFLKKELAPPFEESVQKVYQLFDYTGSSIPSLQAFMQGIQSSTEKPARSPDHSAQVFPVGFANDELDEVLALMSAANVVAPVLAGGEEPSAGGALAEAEGDDHGFGE